MNDHADAAALLAQVVQNMGLGQNDEVLSLQVERLLSIRDKAVSNYRALRFTEPIEE